MHDWIPGAPTRPSTRSSSPRPDRGRRSARQRGSRSTPTAARPPCSEIARRPRLPVGARRRHRVGERPDGRGVKRARARSTVRIKTRTEPRTTRRVRAREARRHDLVEVVGLPVGRLADRRRRRTNDRVMDRRGAGLAVLARRRHRVAECVPTVEVSSEPLPPEAPLESVHDSIHGIARRVRTRELGHDRLVASERLTVSRRADLRRRRPDLGRRAEREHRHAVAPAAPRLRSRAVPQPD